MVDKNPTRTLPADFHLASGSHATPDDGMCLMEAVAYVAGEPHSDNPVCASPTLTRHAIRLNDRWTDDERQLLAPLIPKLVGTSATAEVDLLRMYCLVDSAIREIGPIGLDAATWNDLGDRLRALPPIVDAASARAAQSILAEVRDQSYERKKHAYVYAAAYAADATAYATAYAADAYATAYAAAHAADAIVSAYAYAYANANAYAADAIVAAYAAAHAAYADADAANAAKARRPIVLASLAAFERAIAITDAP